MLNHFDSVTIVATMKSNTFFSWSDQSFTHSAVVNIYLERAVLELFKPVEYLKPQKVCLKT